MNEQRIDRTHTHTWQVMENNNNKCLNTITNANFNARVELIKFKVNFRVYGECGVRVL